ncbi:MAG: glycosyltransferase, partial [Spirochaetota bacterium]
MSEPLYASVIIPTYNRKQLVERVLKYYSLQSERRFEVVVVNDGSDDGTSSLFQNLQKMELSCRGSESNAQEEAGRYRSGTGNGQEKNKGRRRPDENEAGGNRGAEQYYDRIVEIRKGWWEAPGNAGGTFEGYNFIQKSYSRKSVSPRKTSASSSSPGVAPHPFSLKYIELKKSGRSAARNTGVLMAGYPLIIFADDDIFVEPRFVQKHLHSHKEDDRCVVMGKVIHTRNIHNPFSARWKPRDINTAFLSTGNASVLKRYLLHAGLFDEGYTIYGWEDFDMGVNLRQMGLRSVKKRIYGYHYHRPERVFSPEAVYRKEKERGFSAVYFYKNHPLRWVKRFTMVHNGVLEAVFRILGFRNWFLSRHRMSYRNPLFVLIVRYKGYFDGITEGRKQYLDNSSLQKPMDLVIFSNGPGEISTWVSPFVEAVKKSGFGERYRVVLVIHPCQFGSGTEDLVARKLHGVDLVMGPRDYLKLILTGRGKKTYRLKKEGIMVSLGGDLMHPVVFKKRIKGRHSLFAYTNHPGWHKHYQKIFVRDRNVKNAYTSNPQLNKKLVCSGDLVYSSIYSLKEREQVRSQLGLNEAEKMVVFLPGSRGFEVRYMLPVFLKVIADLTEMLPEIKPFFLKSPFVSYEMMQNSLQKAGDIKEADAIPGRIVKGEKMSLIEYAGNRQVGVLEGGLEVWGEG